MWVALPKGSNERRAVQALILLAAACLHRDRARATPERSVRPALRCYRSAMAKLDGLPERLLDLDLPALRHDVVACVDALDADAAPDAWPPPPRLGDR